MNLASGLALLALFGIVLSMFAASLYVPKARNKKLARVAVLVPFLVGVALILAALVQIYLASAARGR